MIAKYAEREGTACLFLRLEGPQQSWGGRTIGRFRRTEPIPQKSGVLGLVGAALGLTRQQFNKRLDELNQLTMTVRVDRGGVLLKDYQTVGAKIGVLSADGKIKKTAGTGEFEAVISPREYLIDASFLVILRGKSTLIDDIGEALRNPRWPLFLGRKRCVPGTAVFAGIEYSLTLIEALHCDGPDDQSLLPPDEDDKVRVVTELLDLETFTSLAMLNDESAAVAFENARSYFTDQSVCLDPPVHGGRIVLDFQMPRPQSRLERPNLSDELFGIAGPQKARLRANDPEAKKLAREKSKGRCIFCGFKPRNKKKLHAHHLTYVRRGREKVTDDTTDTPEDDFVMLCEECHDAVSMLEYQKGFGLDRIDPRKPEWRSRILEARQERRRHANSGRPKVSPIVGSIATAGFHQTGLIKSVIPLKAGTSFATNSPGNRWLENRNHVHQRLSMAFPEPVDRFAARGYGVTRDQGGFLFRVEEDRPVARLIVRSLLLPDWGRAFRDAGWLFDAPIPTPQSFDIATITEGSTWTFCLDANPTVKLKVPGKKNGRRAACVTEEQQINWLMRRAANCGFCVKTDAAEDGSEIPNVRAVPFGKQNSFRNKDKRTLTHYGVRFDGVLQVTDAAKFVNALESGIGSAKAFGFGLLSIARV